MDILIVLEPAAGFSNLVTRVVDSTTSFAQEYD
jgi:hypothetical protein